MKSMIYFIAAMALATPVTMSIAPTVQAAAIHAPKFVQMAGMAGMFEVESSRIALQKSQNQQVKDFAQQMITDHTKANEQLKSVVQSPGVKATVPQALDSKHQKMIDQLNAASGAEFDTKYIKMQLEGHKGAVALFTNYAKSGDNKDLKSFASETLPTLQHHLKMVQSLSAGSQG